MHSIVLQYKLVLWQPHILKIPVYFIQWGKLESVVCLKGGLCLLPNDLFSFHENNVTHVDDLVVRIC